MEYIDAAAEWFTAFAGANNSRERATANMALEPYREAERKARRRYERIDRTYRKATT
jgi:hypothetical protein